MDELLDEAAISGLRTRLRSASGGRFDEVGRVGGRVDGHKLRTRVDMVEAALVDDLPATYADAAVVVRSALGDPTFAGWTLWPVGEAITTLALASTDRRAVDDALAIMADLTPRFSSEFAIRRLLDHDLDRGLAAALGWTTHVDPHVRRLASEGTRPYLPWAVRVREIIERPDAAVPILDALYRDDDEVVRRSVANHANDLSRHAPDLLEDMAQRWTDDPDEHTRAVVRHALRTLVKQGRPRALAMQGFVPVEVVVAELTVRPTVVTLPASIEIEFQVTNVGAEAAVLAVDYVVHYRKQNGSLAPKVFKLATRTVGPGETVDFRKAHALRQMTTRVHHEGGHEVEVQVNGVRHGRASFDVIV